MNKNYKLKKTKKNGGGLMSIFRRFLNFFRSRGATDKQIVTIKRNTDSLPASLKYLTVEQLLKSQEFRYKLSMYLVYDRTKNRYKFKQIYKVVNLIAQKTKLPGLTIELLKYIEEIEEHLQKQTIYATQETIQSTKDNFKKQQSKKNVTDKFI